MKERNWRREIRIKEGNILIYETESRHNRLLFDSSEELSKYDRRELAYNELFLRHEGYNEIANKINKHLGKIIRAKDCDDLLVPNGHYRTNIPLDHLSKVIERYISQDGLNLNPDFQRAHVWDMPKRVAYLEFLLKGGDSTPIYLNHEGWYDCRDGEFVIVDGKQRLTSILMFLNNEFTVFKSMDEEGVGFYAREFDMIPNDVIFVINDLPNIELVLKWYLQINEGNVAHTEEELNKVRNMLDKIDEN